MNEETIRLTDLSIGYTTKNGRRVVAEAINATIFSGQLTCLIGANGGVLLSYRKRMQCNIAILVFAVSVSQFFVQLFSLFSKAFPGGF